jgi:hypothetical protein
MLHRNFMKMRQPPEDDGDFGMDEETWCYAALTGALLAFAVLVLWVLIWITNPLPPPVKGDLLQRPLWDTFAGQVQPGMFP